ncbi:hypothetical protein Tco_1107947 [Tanacetum coccineum]
MDTGASSHLNFNASNLSTIFDKRLFPSVHVGDGKSIPVTNTGHSIIPSHHRPLHLHNVLVTPNIIKNLISVRQFTRDNNCTIEFDAFGFSVKDYLTRHILLRCDSSGDLYPVTKPSTLPIASLDKCFKCFNVASTPRTSGKKWIQAMDEEIKSIEKNDTWELTTLLKGQKAIGVKWKIHQMDVKSEIELAKNPVYHDGSNLSLYSRLYCKEGCLSDTYKLRRPSCRYLHQAAQRERFLKTKDDAWRWEIKFKGGVGS